MLCMGRRRPKRRCASASASAPDDAVLVTDRAFAGADTLATSYALAAAIRRSAKEQAVDLVFTGKQTIDGDTAQVGPASPSAWAWNLLTYVSKIVEAGPGGPAPFKVERRAEGGVQLLKTTLPSLITMLEGTNEMRFATMDDMLRAARFQVRKWNKDDAGIEDVSKIGLKGSPTVVSKVFGPTPRSEKALMQVRGATPRPATSVAEPAPEDLHPAPDAGRRALFPTSPEAHAVSEASKPAPATRRRAAPSRAKPHRARRRRSPGAATLPAVRGRNLELPEHLKAYKGVWVFIEHDRGTGSTR